MESYEKNEKDCSSGLCFLSEATEKQDTGGRLGVWRSAARISDEFLDETGRGKTG